MLRIRVSRVIGILITALALTGIGGMGDLQPNLAQAVEEYEHLRVALDRALAGMDPLGYPRLDRQELNVHMCFFDHLFDRTADGKMGGNLATKYEWLNDTTMRVYLRKGVKFHNGDEFTAADVKWSIEDMLNPDRGPGMVTLVKGVKEVKIVDDYTVDFYTEAPFPTLPTRLCTYTVMVSSKERSKIPPEVYEKNPMGTGPFKFVEWKKGNYVTMVRNENYWKGVPKIKKLTIYEISDQTTVVSGLKSGAIDIAYNLSPSLGKDIKNTPGLEVTSRPSCRIETVWFRTEKPPFNDKRVRQAFNYAINRQEARRYRR